jgi:hypothetical protein
VLGQPIMVPREADDAELARMRRIVEAGIDGVHERAYALVGARDPGARAKPRPALDRGSLA